MALIDKKRDGQNISNLLIGFLRFSWKSSFLYLLLISLQKDLRDSDLFISFYFLFSVGVHWEYAERVGGALCEIYTWAGGFVSNPLA